MKRISFIVAALSILIVMEGVSWLAFRSADERDSPLPSEESVEAPPAPKESPASEEKREESTANSPTNESADFPPPTTERVNGRTERTIHMGVRQWQWDPDVIVVKQGELVRLVIHNADVLHGLVIPELGVNQDIPPDGAIVEFVASRSGSFEFFCSVWCGEGHMEMRGRLRVE